MIEHYFELEFTLVHLLYNLKTASDKHTWSSVMITVPLNYLNEGESPG